jgi:hypothetical protein
VCQPREQDPLSGVVMPVLDDSRDGSARSLCNGSHSLVIQLTITERSHSLTDVTSDFIGIQRRHVDLVRVAGACCPAR